MLPTPPRGSAVRVRTRATPPVPVRTLFWLMAAVIGGFLAVVAIDLMTLGLAVVLVVLGLV